MAKKTFKNISSDAQTVDNLRIISKLSGKSQAQILREIINPIASLMTTFDPTKEKCGFWVDVYTIKSQVMVTIFGRRNLVCEKVKDVPENREDENKIIDSAKITLSDEVRREPTVEELKRLHEEVQKL